MGNEGPRNSPRSEETNVQEHALHDPEKFLEGVKRPYGIEDIKNFQEVLAAFEKRRIADNAAYVYGVNSFYEFLVEYRKGTPERIRTDEVPVKGYEEIEVKLFTRWRDHIISSKEPILKSTSDTWKEVLNILESESAPTTLEELRALYINYPEVDRHSAVHYQSGVSQKGETRSGFVHLNLQRAGFAREKEGGEEMRVYLNPPYTAIPELSKLLMNRSIQEQVPLYFKTIDYSDSINRDNVTRLDRLVIYTSKDSIPKLVDIIENIRTEHPDWFERRELPTLVATVADGVGIASEPTEYQNQKFSQIGEKKTSFNMVRAKFLHTVWKSVMRDALNKNQQLRPRNGRTLREIFDVTFIEAAMRWNKDAERSKLMVHLEELWSAKLNPESVTGTTRRVLEDTFMRVLADVLPYTTPESIAPFVKQAINQHAEEYGIDPENIALNKSTVVQPAP